MSKNELAEQVYNILFPPPKKLKQNAWLDSNSCDELSGALYDMEEGRADEVCVKTVRMVQTRLYQVQKLLEDAGIGRGRDGDAPDCKSG